MDGGARHECSYCHAIWMEYERVEKWTEGPIYGYVMIQKGVGHWCPYSWWCEDYEIEKGSCVE